MKKILFSTGNQRKIKEACAACDLFDIEVVPIKLEFPEIQSHDPLDISKQKAEDAFRLAGESAIVVADSSWSIPALNGFPGGYMKDVNEWFTSQDFLNLLSDKEDRTIVLHETIVYKDQQQTKVFTRQFPGLLAESPRGIDGDSFDKVAEFSGRTLAETHDLGETSHDPKDYIWYQFAEWYAKQ